MIKDGIPSVVLVTERFITLAKASMRGNGVPDAPMVVLPRTELTEYVDPEAVRSVARGKTGLRYQICASPYVRRSRPTESARLDVSEDDLRTRA